MTVEVTAGRLTAAYDTACRELLSRQTNGLFWEGRLSSSALSTATAVSALSIAALPEDAALRTHGVAWLCRTQCADGGWGDTPDSPSNLATTCLAIAALNLAKIVNEAVTLAQARADAYLTTHAGHTPDERRAAICAAYGNDRTFAVPILTTCALAGLIPWGDIPDLPYELALFPARWYPLLRLHVVSYALPALIAVGIVIEEQQPARHPVKRAVRRLLRAAVLRKLPALQPEHGGFLEATPLTSFVAMSLLPIIGKTDPVVKKCLGFIRHSVCADGSWPIDTNLATWVTTSAVTALAQGGGAEINRAGLREWIAGCQYHTVHPYTQAAPGGWGWTHLPGGVPDGDDTAGALLALHALGERAVLPAGVQWLLQLQNTDGGWPTFCRGWGQLPFDKSSPDITAHVIRAFRVVAPDDPAVQQALARGMHFLAQSQQKNGAWIPLWFGNQMTSTLSNPVFGAARVLPALADHPACETAAARGRDYLLSAQHANGGWGGDIGIAPTVEETALALIGLTPWHAVPEIRETLQRGVAYLLTRIEDGSWITPAPIGLYFAKLWYAEAMYPVVWTVEALGRLMRLWEQSERVP